MTQDLDQLQPRRPRWAYFVPYPGPMPQLTFRQWRVMGLLACAELFDQYDVGIMSLLLSRIQAGLDIPDTQIASVTAVARLGMLFAFLVAVLADRMGRRKLLLYTIVGFTLCTFATAFARTPAEYMILQFAARVFIAAETALAVVVVTEELAAKNRGFGIGLLGAFGGLGHGVASIVFAFVEQIPFGWRGMYAIGVVPMLLLGWFRRTLPETRRFEAHEQSQSANDKAQSIFAPVAGLVRGYPRRALALSCAVFPFQFVVMAAVTFLPKTLEEVHGYTPGTIGLLYVGGGALGILGNLISGRLSDAIGRRTVLTIFLCANMGAIAGFYNLSGWVVIPLWITTIFTFMGSEVLFKALGSELFPTAYRSTASGMRMAVQTLGAVAGLFLEGRLFSAAGSHGMAITWMVPAMLITPIIVYLTIPETARRELEDVSPEDGAPTDDSITTQPIPGSTNPRET